MAGDIVLPEFEPVGEELVGLPSDVILAERGGGEPAAGMAGLEETEHFGIDGQSVVASQDHAEVAGRVIADTADAAEAAVQFVGRSGEVFQSGQVGPVLGDVDGQGVQVVGPVAHAGDPFEVGRTGGGEADRGGEALPRSLVGGYAPVFDQLGDHGHGLPPSDVAGADDLDDVLEECGTAEQPAEASVGGGAMGRRITAKGVEAGEVLVEPEHPANGGPDGHRLWP